MPGDDNTPYINSTEHAGRSNMTAGKQAPDNPSEQEPEPTGGFANAAEQAAALNSMNSK